MAVGLPGYPVTVRSRRGGFADEGLSKFGQVRDGRGRKPGITTAAKVEEIIRVTQQEEPSGERIGVAGRWPKRSGLSGHGFS